MARYTEDRMASPAAARRTPRNTIESDDAVAMRAAELAEWARRNARAILIGAVVALVAVGGYMAYRMSADQRAERASQQYLTVQQNVATTADSAAARRELESFIRRFDGTREADEARLELGQRLLGAGQVKEAIPHFRAVAEGGSPMAYQGASLLGAALAQDGQRDQAIRAYLDIADDAELQYQKQQARSEAAILHEQAGNWKAAADLYRVMRDASKEGSLERSILELRVAEAEGHAAAGGAAAPAPR